MTNDPGKQFADKAKGLFDESVEQLDGATLSRLNQGRHKALEELQRPAGIPWGRWAPAAGVAAVAVMAVLVMRGPEGVDPVADIVTASDFEMLLESDGLEMYEDLEFFSLLEEMDLEANGNVG